MIHVITAANRSLYERQLEEMHRLRWQYYIAERGWEELRAMQTKEGVEYDDFDDARAVYLMGIETDGSVSGGMRIRPTDDHSLLADKFMHLLDDPASFKPGPDVWEITRVVRKPENRTKDYALRFSMNTTMLEVALSRGVKKLVATMDTFLFPASRGLWRQKLRPLGLPAPYAEGEMIALMYDADEESLAMLRERAGLVSQQMFELAAPVADRPVDIVAAERVARLASLAQVEELAEVAAWFEGRGIGVKADEGATT